MVKPLVVDTSYWVSLLCIADNNHAKALENVVLFDSTENDLYITEFIYSEAATVLARKLGKKGFIRAGEAGYFPTTEVSYFLDKDKRVFDLAKKEFYDVEDRRISFIDLHTALTAKELTANVLTFDRHFKALGRKYGFRVLP